MEKVYYPGLESHPYHEVAKQTMRGYGGLVTFLIKDADWRETANIVDAVKIPRIAPSLGGVESLIEQPLVMSYYQCTPEERQQFGIYDNMIRMSCGIENAEDLIDDLEQAFDSTIAQRFIAVQEGHRPLSIDRLCSSGGLSFAHPTLWNVKLLTQTL